MAMRHRKVLLVGPRPTSEIVSGMRIGFELLIAGFEERSIPHTVVNRALGMTDKTVGSLTFASALANVYLFLAYWKGLLSAASVYITIGTSRLGFVRDALMIWSAALLRKRTILHLKGGGFRIFYEESHPLLQYCVRRTFARADRIIVLGKLLVDQFQFVPDIETKLRVVPNGLSEGLSDEPVAPKSLKETKVLRLLYLSNLIPAKGYLDLLEACAILRKRGVPIVCDYCGALVRTINDDGIEISESYFRARMEQLELEDVVRYHGTVHGERKEEFLQNAHIFLLPTSYPWEGQPISIIEALAYATPVISTPYRGIPEQVIHDHNGFLIAPGCPEEIANSVERLWNDPEKYASFSRNALHHFRTNFTRQAHLDRIIPIILGKN